MPLDGQNGQSRVHQPFYYIVPGAADWDQILSRAVYGLVVGGVYQSAAAVELIKEVRSVYITFVNVVHLILSDPFVPVCSFDVLCDVAAEIHVDDLEALADTEHGLFFRYKERERLKLQNIQLGVYMTGAVIALSEEGGCDIAAAREEQMGCGLGGFGIQSGVMGYAQLVQGFFVVFGIGGAAKNGDSGESRHGGFLLEKEALLYLMQQERKRMEIL